MAPLSFIDQQRRPGDVPFVEDHSYGYKYYADSAPTAKDAATVAGNDAAKVTKKPKKSVSFNEAATQRYTLHINNYTDEEVDACWWTPEEFKAIRADARYAANLVMGGYLQNGDNDHYCKRGVENFTREGVYRRSSVKQAAYAAVLDEQDAQWDEGIFEQEFIAYAYAPHSEASHSFAHSVALQDEMEIQLMNMMENSPIEYDDIMEEDDEDIAMRDQPPISPVRLSGSRDW